MRFLILLLAVTLLVACTRIESRPDNLPTQMNKSSFYDFKMKSIDGNEIDFSGFKGKKVLIVNTASECGFTPQYEDLENLNKKYGDKVTIIGFPANNFGGQEPGSNSEIKTFCSKNYGVGFLMMEKISVKGNDVSPLFKWLSSKDENGWNNEAPNWNFCKYLVDENGNLIKFYSSKVNPMSDEIVTML